MNVFEFLQNEVLKMNWLDKGVAGLLSLTGIDMESRVAGSIRFFLFDTIKIFILLSVLIFLISFIQSYFPPERTKKILSRSGGFAARILAALMGTVTPFCSCSSIPLFIGFTSAGLSIGVTFSFLISSPMVDLGSLVLLASIFGWKIAAVYVGTGLTIAVLGGIIISHLRMEDQVEEFVRKAKNVESESVVPSKKERASYALERVWETIRKVWLYIMIGVGVGAFIHNWIPEEFVVKALGTGNPFGVIIATVLGIPMYADIFGCIPIAEALLAKGARLGVVLSFMMAVTTLSVPSLIMLRKAVKGKLLAVFIVICTIGIILTGYFFNMLEPFLI